MVSYFLANDGSLSLFLKGRWHVVASDHENYEKVKKGLATLKEEDLVKLIDKATTINNWGAGNIQVQGGVILYKGEEVKHKAVVDKIFALIRANLPATPLLNFLDRLMLNPRSSARNELYDFLENKGLPITPEGMVLAYKAVQPNYLDIYSGTIDNTPGRTIKIDPGLVDDNRQHHCSKGLHVGALEYAESYGGSNCKLLVVLVDPAHVVSVPTDYSCQKMRVCQYTVLKDFKEELTAPVYTAQAEEITDDYFDEGDVESYEDYDDDTDYYDEDYDTGRWY